MEELILQIGSDIDKAIRLAAEFGMSIDDRWPNAVSLFMGWVFIGNPLFIWYLLHRDKKACVNGTILKSKRTL